jgi:hypothetical protein
VLTADLRAENERLERKAETWKQTEAVRNDELLAARAEHEALKATLERLEHLLGSPGDMSRDEILVEGRRLITETRGATDEGQAADPIAAEQDRENDEWAAGVRSRALREQRAPEETP